MRVKIPGSFSLPYFPLFPSMVDAEVLLLDQKLVIQAALNEKPFGMYAFPISVHPALTNL